MKSDSWVAGLKSLVNLQKLYLQTTSSLTSNPGGKKSEKKLILQWLEDDESSHRQLSEVTLWYSLGKPINVLSSWKRLGNIWERVHMVENADHEM